jgi:hypothetical protein
MSSLNNALNTKKPFKLWKVILVVVILFFPVKWFIYTPFYNQFLSASMSDIDESAFKQKLLDIAAYEGKSSTYHYVNSDYGNARSLVPGEIILSDVSNTGKSGQYFTTLNNRYFYKEEGYEPIWRSCVYKEEGDNKILLKIPGNCKTWTRLNIVASNKSSDLLVYEIGMKTLYYIIQDEGDILRYKNIVERINYLK